LLVSISDPVKGIGAAMSELLNPSEGDDFEWVNAWATKSNPAPKSDPKVDPAPKQVSAPDTGAPATEQSAAPQPAPDASSPRKPAFDPEMFVHPATRRFFATFRTPPAAEPIAPPAAEPAPPPALLPEPPAAEVAVAEVTTPAAIVQREPAAVESSQVSLVPEADQLERDIAEIQRVRDALLAQPSFTIIDPHKVHGRFARLRNSDAVPIVIGTVVGLTLLIVFGAAASLITLR